MLQTRLPVEISPEDVKNLDQKLRELYLSVKGRFKKFGVFQDVIVNFSSYQSSDLKFNQTPEEFIRRIMIEPLLKFLGFEIIPETALKSPTGRKQPDYTVKPQETAGPLLYIEAEALNVDLNSKGHGVSQVKGWLISRASKTDYGIATDGLRWILLKFDKASANSKPVMKVDLQPVFLKMLNPAAFVTENKIKELEREFLTFSYKNITFFLEGFLENIEKKKEDISKKFYHDYVRYIFGYDKKGNKTQGISLLDKVIPPTEVINPNKDVKLFSVVFMNRLIFIRFLEEKGIVPKKLLNRMLENYRKSRTPASFYKAYLTPLFYEVFNKRPKNRPSAVVRGQLYDQIPYLNGGLFREVIAHESNYDIDNEGIELVLDNLLENYKFGLDSDINPDILGYIFEKTINFISGPGSNQQKMKGAYYTPDDVVEFIIERTLIPEIFRKMIQGLKDSGWSDTDLKGYNSIEDLMEPENITKNPKHINKMLKSIEKIKVLDPACGSGHFLTATLTQILRIKEGLLRTNGENVDRCALKRDIVSQNIFGVDIDENAVEIAKLRLWLSIIEDVEGPAHISTLPNIDFNIFTGNSLIGWLDEKLSTHPLTHLLIDSQSQEKFNSLREIYGKELNDIKKSMEKMRLGDTVKAYRKLVDIYNLESGEHALSVKFVLEDLRGKMYELINNAYLDFVHENCNLKKAEFDAIAKNLSLLSPFHWRIDFNNIIEADGFDVVIGNPPYGNILKNLEEKILAKFETKDANEIAANFVERCLVLVKKEGYLGLVLANSIAINKSTSTARSLIRKNMSVSMMALFGTRPTKIFPGAEIRVMIFLGKKDLHVSKKNGVIFTTEAIKFTKDMRSSIMNSLSFGSTYGLTLGKKKIGDGLDDISLPKVGNSTIRNILLKLKAKSKTTVGEKINKPAFKHEMQFRKTGGYWLNALEQMPYKSTKIETVSTKTTLERDFLILLINSSLFYLYWSTYGNLRDFPRSLLEKFPFPPQVELRQNLKMIHELKEKTSECLLRSFKKGTGRVGEFRTAKCRDILNRIDDLLCLLYNLTKKETNFIKKYDLHIRS